MALMPPPVYTGSRNIFNDICSTVSFLSQFLTEKSFNEYPCSLTTSFKHFKHLFHCSRSLSMLFLALALNALFNNDGGQNNFSHITNNHLNQSIVQLNR